MADSLSAVYDTGSEPPSTFDPDAGLDHYLAYAATQSPSLRAAFYREETLLEKAGHVGSLPDPFFSFGYFVESVETRVGPQTARFRLNQTIPWFGTLGARKDVTIEAANSAHQQYQSEKLRLFYDVKSAYYAYYYLGRDIAITEENLQLLTFWETVVRAKYRVALTQHPDVIKAQVELGKLEDRLKSLQDMTEPAQARLRAVLNVPEGTRIPAPSAIDVSEVTLDRDDVIAQALVKNPDLRSLTHLIDSESAEKRLAGKASWPSFVVGVEYIQTGKAIDPTVKDSGKDAWLVGVGLNLPIWFGKNAAKKREAEARYRSAQHDYAAAKNQLRLFVEEIIFKHADALRKTRLYRDGLVPKAEQALSASYTAYQAGETDFLNLLDAQRQLLDFQLSYERARVDLAIACAEIEMITGNQLGASKPE